MKVAVVGSTALDPLLIENHLIKQMVALPPDSTILLRRGRKTPPGRVELLAAAVAHQLKLPIEWRMPEGGTGRPAVFNRDVSMVAAADAVWAYFAPDQVMEGGTGHVVEKALDQNRPVYAWAPMDGEMKDVGSHEPEMR